MGAWPASGGGRMVRGQVRGRSRLSGDQIPAARRLVAPGRPTVVAPDSRFARADHPIPVDHSGMGGGGTRCAAGPGSRACVRASQARRIGSGDLQSHRRAWASAGSDSHRMAEGAGCVAGDARCRDAADGDDPQLGEHDPSWRSQAA